MKLFSKRNLIVFGIILLVLVIIAGVALYIKYPTTSPQTSASYLIDRQMNPHKKLNKDFVGFLAYWRMDDPDIESIRFDLLSELIYFSLYVGKDGHIIKVVENETDPGWLRWKGPKVRDLIAKTQIKGGKFAVSVAMQKNKDLESFLDSQDAQKNLINDLKTEVRDTHIDGINLDFEYDGEPDPKYRNKFTEFTTKLTTSLRNEFPNLEISIDVYSLAVRKQRLIDIPKVAPNFDKVIIMAYDFYASYSDTTGPIAPMSGYSQEKFLFDIETAYKDFAKYVKPQKLILGVPYYGYDWPVENAQEYMSTVLEQSDENGYVEVLSYSRMRKDSKFNSKTQCKWDELAQAPWCWYVDEKTGSSRQAWFENNKSIEKKLNFVSEKNLSGIAVWLVGYDSGYQDLSNMIQRKFSQ